MKVTIQSIEGKEMKSIELPEFFSETYRPDVIKRAHKALYSKKYQPKGANPRAGLRTSAESWDTGSGASRMPRVKAGPHRAGRSSKGRRFPSKGRWFPAAGTFRIAPGTRGGRQAHPPKAEKVILEKVNKKELKFAFTSALAATAQSELVAARGHQIEGLTVPLVVDDQLATLTKTADFKKALTAIGLSKELARTQDRSIRAGRGKTRGRKYKTKRGPLVVLASTTKKETGMAVRNLPGVEITHANKLSLLSLAPGGVSGRLTVWTPAALKELEGRLA